jgi:ABC-type transport system involved in multi-copper enzyme maturation permease subunit
MIRTLAFKELHEILLSPKFVVIFAVSTVLVLLSAYTGVTGYGEEVREFRIAEQLNRDSLRQGSWGEMRDPGATVIRAPSPLSVVVQGVQGVMGRKTDAGMINPRVRESRNMVYPVFAVFGGLDLSFVVATVLSLFAILLSYDMISGEKERGTLKLLLAGGVSRAEVMAGKLIGGYLSLVVPFAVPLLLAALLFAVHPNVGWTGADWGRFVLILVFAVLYLAVFFVVGLLVSAMTSRPAVSFLVLLLIWVCAVAITPRAAVLLASQISPAPSYDQLLLEQESVSRDLRGQMAERITEEVNERIRLAGYAERMAQGEEVQQDVQRTVAEAREDIRNEVEGELNRTLADSFEDFSRRQAQLVATARAISRVSPTSAFSFAAQVMAGTDVESQERFVRAVQSYREGYLEYIAAQAEAHPDQVQGGTNVNIGMSAGPQGPQINFSQSEMVHELDLSGMPQFRTVLAPVGNSLRAATPDLVVLSLMLAVALVACYAAFRRYDPR